VDADTLALTLLLVMAVPAALYILWMKRRPK
jgi:hypothetical protein